MGEESRSRAAAAVHAKRHTAGTRAREGERRCIDNKFGLEAMRYPDISYIQWIFLFSSDVPHSANWSGPFICGKFPNRNLNVCKVQRSPLTTPTSTLQPSKLNKTKIWFYLVALEWQYHPDDWACEPPPPMPLLHPLLPPPSHAPALSPSFAKGLPPRNSNEIHASVRKCSAAASRAVPAFLADTRATSRLRDLWRANFNFC